MASDELLRDNHRKLLEKLKQSQEHISKLIIAAKHSDHRVLSEPLTSTVLGINEKNPLEESKKLIEKANQSLRNPKIDFEAPKFSASSTLKQTKSKVSASKVISSKKPVNQVSKISTHDDKPRHKTLRFGNSAIKKTKLLDCADNMRPYSGFTEEIPLKPTRSILKAPVPSGAMISLSEDEENSDIFACGDFGGLHTKQKKVTAKTTEESTTNNQQQPHTQPQQQTDTRPLLGYDWIAGVMDNESLARPSGSAIDLSDDVIDEIKEFRRTHRNECQSGSRWDELMRTPKTPKTPTTAIDMLPKIPNQVEKSPDPNNIYDPRIVNYTINKRLFPVAVNPVQSQQPGSRKSPRYVRVSVPKVALASPHRYEPRRKGAYGGGADSLALPEHCVQGWQQTVRRGNKAAKRPQKAKDDEDPGLDLRSSIRPRDTLTQLQLNAGQFPDHGCWTAEDDYKKSYLHISSQDLLDQSYAVQLAHQKLRNDCKYKQ